jgi:hypothetical protein
MKKYVFMKTCIHENEVNIEPWKVCIPRNWLLFQKQGEILNFKEMSFKKNKEGITLTYTKFEFILFMYKKFEWYFWEKEKN